MASNPATSFFDRVLIPNIGKITNFFDIYYRVKDVIKSHGYYTQVIGTDKEAYTLDHLGSSKRPNKDVFILKTDGTAIVAKIRVEVTPEVPFDLSNMEFSFGSGPNMWYRKIASGWELSKDNNNEIDPLSGSYVPLTSGGRRRTRRNRKSKSKSKSYSRRR